MRQSADTDIAFQGRTLAEYRRFFDLTPDRWQSVLDCGAGPGSATAAMRDRTRAVAVDPAYRQSRARLKERSAATVGRLRASLPDIRDRFVWEFYADPEERLAYFDRAHREFLADFADTPGCYVAGALPSLPFRSDSFELVLVAHLLFLYEDLGAAFHRRAAAELCRVARSEVRLYPLAGLDGTASAMVDPVVSWAEGAGHDTERRAVPFEFQRGADEMLVISPV